MNEFEKKNLIDLLEAMREAFRYIESGVDCFSVKAGAVEIKMDATEERSIDEH